MRQRLVLATPLLLLGSTLLAVDPPPAPRPYPELVLEDAPVAYWRFDDASGERLANAAGEGLSGTIRRVDVRSEGPRAARFPAFDRSNRAGSFGGDGGAIIVPDPGAASPLDFALGESITVEAWVLPFSIRKGQHVYIVGKGRTDGRSNQNWSLRLTGGPGGDCRLSFLFRDADDRPRADSGYEHDWHRWTSSTGFEAGDGWHHVAASYTFGASDSLTASIDGKPVPGTWDMGGATNEAPVVDDSALWIGSSQSGSSGNSFAGLIDEVAIHRRVLSPERIARRFVVDPSAPDGLEPEAIDLRDGAVVVQLLEGGLPDRSWSPPRRARVTGEYHEPDFAFVGVPRKYGRDRDGLVSATVLERSNPFLLRAAARVSLPAGRYRVLLRSLNGARLALDGEFIANTRFVNPNSDGHEEVPDLPAAMREDLRPLPVGHAETVADVTLDGEPHVFRLEAFAGGKRLRQEIGELVVALARVETRDGVETVGPFRILSPRESMRALDDASWVALREQAMRRIAERNRDARARARVPDDGYWRRRHELARELARSRPIEAPETEAPVFNDVDRFIGARLDAAGVGPRALVDDHAFLRRLSLDTRGIPPSVAELEAFLVDSAPGRRARAVDRMLESPAWADHWIPYWQDVLAENPGILKPKLNNTGPFRWWLREAMRDNLPADRFVTELLLMEGSRYDGGPAAFAMATQNDVPMAAKAHIVGTAFLGAQMKCARCHDAPHHDFEQADLFSVAAMLERAPLRVPETSSVPRSKEELEEMIINVSLEPGQKVGPRWPFSRFAPAEVAPELLRRKDDHRERLAALITQPANERFPRVLANRLWKRFMGYGLVDPVDDWDGAEVSHPELLDFLAREIVVSGYDLKQLARLILSSHAYQREALGDARDVPGASERLFAGPARRRLTAEQLVDSLFAVVGKEFGSEPLNLDVDARRSVETFLNLGTPRRAWEFASLSNERDRPALSLPVAQSLIDVLKTFGWRETRQDPITVREEVATVLQPLLLANGTAGNRVTTISENGALVELCLKAGSTEELVRGLFRTLLTREPGASEIETFGALLDDGFAERVRASALVAADSASDERSRKTERHAVSWSNHLSAKASEIKLELERLARLGDPPTRRLKSAWRERAEDAVWALLNSPEFIFVP